jgi:hypothetical protein
MQTATVLSLMASMSLLLMPATCTINFGNANGVNRAWIDGIDPSAASGAINPLGQDPCNILFNIDNSGAHSGYMFVGCGGPVILLQNGIFNSMCHNNNFDFTSEGGVLFHQQWSC